MIYEHHEGKDNALSIGYLGPPGSFCEEATIRLVRSGIVYDLIASSLIPGRTIRELIVSVENGSLPAAVVPIENSIEGSVSETLDLLVRSEDLFIQCEITIPVSHNLLIWGSNKSRPVEEILSHPQALAQCRNYILRRFPGVRERATTSTAEAAREVSSRKDSGPVAAAIGTLRAAELYGLSVVDIDIQDVQENETRFVLLAKSATTRSTGRDKTSIAFSTMRDRPGALYSILEEFAKRSLNLTKIESRPTKRMLGEYIFFVDCQGHKDDPDVADAIMGLRPKTSYLKILGSYPEWSRSISPGQ